VRVGLIEQGDLSHRWWGGSLVVASDYDREDWDDDTESYAYHRPIRGHSLRSATQRSLLDEPRVLRGEREMAFAMVQQAMNEAIPKAHPLPRDILRQEDAARWIERCDENPHGFAWACAVAGLDAETMRTQARRNGWSEAPLIVPFLTEDSRLRKALRSIATSVRRRMKRARAFRDRPRRICGNTSCGLTFVAKSTRQKFCSTVCRLGLKSEWHQPTTAPVRSRSDAGSQWSSIPMRLAGSQWIVDQTGELFCFVRHVGHLVHVKCHETGDELLLTERQWGMRPEGY
jgi:hypothetical protein